MTVIHPARPRRALPALVTLTLLTTVLLGGCTRDPGTDEDPAATAVAARALNGQRVVAISVDGLMPRALRRLGRARTPNLHRLIGSEGAGTMNARSQVEMTITLPNHTSMVTGRRITASRGGHGVTWNDDAPTTTVQAAAGHDVASVFTVVHDAGGTTGVFSTKSKFSLFDRSWPAAVDTSFIRVERNAAVTRALRADLVTTDRDFSLLHLGLPDQMGHRYGWMSTRYLDAVVTVDRLVGSVMSTIRGNEGLRSSTVVILTADHGGIAGTRQHSDPTKLTDYRVPFAFWGAGVRPANLYTLNPTRRDPGRGRPGFSASPQPIRNGEIANASLSVLGLGPVPGSLWDTAQDLRWR